MKSEREAKLNVASEAGFGTRNPFGVMDVPDPNDEEVTRFAGSATVEGSADDENAKNWSAADNSGQPSTIEGNWSSRWNGGADPTIPGDAAQQWKQGRGQARITEERVYLYFDWDSGTDRCQTRGSATAGRKIYQFEQPGDYTSLDRQNRKRSKNRRALDRRTPGFPQIDSPAPRPTLPAPRGAAIAAAGRRRG